MAAFRRKNFLEESLLKTFNKREYSRYKEELREFKQRERLNSTPSFNIELLQSITRDFDSISVSHSGNAGDIVYALSTLKKLSEILNKPISLFLKLNQATAISSHYKHPSGQVMLNQKMAQMLIPLIQSQHYIKECNILSNEAIHIDLDSFRHSKMPLDRGDIARWCGYFLGINPSLHHSWISVEPNSQFRNSILLARSERYRNSLINYGFLNSYPNVFFIGVESEFEDMRKTLPKLEWLKVESFLQLAEIIRGSKLFIGNQSLPFSIAEATKSPRLLELYLNSPNVIPAGENGYDFVYQKHLEWLVKELGDSN